MEVNNHTIYTDFLKDLRLRTASYHQQLEETGLSSKLMSPDLSLYTYTSILKAFYGFILPAELSCYSRLSPILPQVTSYKRAHLLKQDLLFLGISEIQIQQLPLCHSTAFTTEADMVGCLYVLEGSKLGGQMISTQIKPLLNFSDNQGTLFFQAHGKDTGYYWKDFIEFLTHYAVDKKQEDAIIKAAQKTFMDFKHWLNSYPVFI